MNIPRYWAKAEENVDTPQGHSYRLRCWGWAHSGVEEAKSKARLALLRLMDRVRQGAPFPERYAYSDRAIREEIVREIPGDGNDPSALITRNSYGSLVLNTSKVMFVDIDVAPIPSAGGISSWFRKKSPMQDTEALDRLRQRASQSGHDFRIYRTAAGFRLLATARCFEPASREAEDVMTRLGADPKFVQLCRAQKSFRARLTPKPWRCNFHAPSWNFPRESASETGTFSEWISGYENACKGYATCAFLGNTSDAPIHEDVSPLLSWHDEFTRASSNLPLA